MIATLLTLALLNEPKDINAKLINYEETSDCTEPSERIEVIDPDTGGVSYVVKSPCEKASSKGEL